MMSGLLPQPVWNRPDSPGTRSALQDTPRSSGHPLLEVSGLPLSGERIQAHYKFRCAPAKAAEIARFLVHEHTVELPSDVLPEGFLASDIVGRVDSISAHPDGGSACTLSYASEVASGGHTTLLTLLSGNGSFLPEIELQDVDLPRVFTGASCGPRFGVEGIRSLLDVKKGALGATALKPVGATPRELARIASALALGGIDIIKEDDGVSTQMFAPFHERVERCAAAIAEAGAKTGKTCIYFANITGPMESLAERAYFAKEKGATGIELLPGPMGLDSIRMVSGLPGLDLPVISHCAWQGALCRPPNPAISMPLVFGLFPRLVGADLSIMPGFGGRFDIPREACRSVTNALQRPCGNLRPAMPMPGGGVTMDRLAEFVDVFGQDTALLMSGALFQKPDLTQACKDFMMAVRNLR